MTKISAGVSALLPWPVWMSRLPSLLLDERVGYLMIGFDSLSMLVESAPTMTVALASMLELKIVERRTGILADYGSCSLLAANARTMIGAELTVHSVQVDAAYAQEMIGAGAEMMDHLVQIDDFPSLSQVDLHQ